MEGTIKRLCVAGLLVSLCAYGAYKVKWQAASGIQGDVAYNIINNKVEYVHPRSDQTPLPRGLFYVRGKSDKKITTPGGKQREPLFAIQNGVVDEKPYVYSEHFNGYVRWNGTHATQYNPGRFIDPSREMAQWREQTNKQLAEAAAYKYGKTWFDIELDVDYILALSDEVERTQNEFGIYRLFNQDPKITDEDIQWEISHLEGLDRQMKSTILRNSPDASEEDIAKANGIIDGFAQKLLARARAARAADEAARESSDDDSE